MITHLLNCVDTQCKTVYIRGLQNYRCSRSIPVLLENVLQKDASVSVASMRALKALPTDVWTDEHKAFFKSVFFQIKKKFDSTARAIALDILLNLRPNEQETKELLEYLKSKDKQFEVKQYLIQRLRMISDECGKFRSLLKKLINNDEQLNNYHILAQKGLSTALSRTYSRSPGFNSSLISIQEMSSGVLKSGIVDLVLESGRSKFSAFSLGIYAGGLSSFVGGSEDEVEKDDSSPTAGMELIVQGSYMRPLKFFTSQGELMGHVWSGTASSTTPAYQATTVLHDHLEHIRLQNGQIITVNVLGSLSVDLSGHVTFSLWNRNAHAEVSKKAAFAVQGQLSIYTSFISLQSEFDITQGPELNLVTDLDFSGDVKLCMQLGQPSTLVLYVDI